MSSCELSTCMGLMHALVDEGEPDQGLRLEAWVVSSGLAKLCIKSVQIRRRRLRNACLKPRTLSVFTSKLTCEHSLLLALRTIELRNASELKTAVEGLAPKMARLPLLDRWTARAVGRCTLLMMTRVGLRWRRRRLLPALQSLFLSLWLTLQLWASLRPLVANWGCFAISPLSCAPSPKVIFLDLISVPDVRERCTSKRSSLCSPRTPAPRALRKSLMTPRRTPLRRETFPRTPLRRESAPSVASLSQPVIVANSPVAGELVGNAPPPLVANWECFIDLPLCCAPSPT